MRIAAAGWWGALALSLTVWVAGAARAATGVNASATALRATVLGTRTVHSDTGPLASSDDARFASAPNGAIAGLGGARALHAAAISSIRTGSAQDEVSSGASLGDLSLNVAGHRIAASFLMSWSAATAGGSVAGGSVVEGLSLNGVPIAASGAPNQRLDLPGITLILNEQRPTTWGLTVNTLHIATWDGLTDVVVASATAAVAP